VDSWHRAGSEEGTGHLGETTDPDLQPLWIRLASRFQLVQRGDRRPGDGGRASNGQSVGSVQLREQLPASNARAGHTSQAKFSLAAAFFSSLRSPSHRQGE
jgi:hypothetical protein